MSSGRTKRGVTKPKRKWSQKKKGQAKSDNRGLPGTFIQKFGTPVERALISSHAWNEFYKSDPGKARATKLVARYAAREADKEKKLTQGLTRDQVNILPQTSEDQLMQIIRANATAKANAKNDK